MNEAERQVARTELVRGFLSLRQFIDDLGGRSYLDLVEKHMHEIGPQLLATIEVHKQLVTPDEQDAAQQIFADALNRSSQPGFWSADAGDFCSSISCDLHDAVFPDSPDEAGVFNLFQLVTAALANGPGKTGTSIESCTPMPSPARQSRPARASSRRCSASRSVIVRRVALASTNCSRSFKMRLLAATFWSQTTSIMWSPTLSRYSIGESSARRTTFVSSCREWTRKRRLSPTLFGTAPQNGRPGGGSGTEPPPPNTRQELTREPPSVL